MGNSISVEWLSTSRSPLSLEDPPSHYENRTSEVAVHSRVTPISEKPSPISLRRSNSRRFLVTLCPTMRKPFDVLAEGLLSQESGGNRTPVELFLSGLTTWEPSLRMLLGVAPPRSATRRINGEFYTSRTLQNLPATT